MWWPNYNSRIKKIDRPICITNICCAYERLSNFVVYRNCSYPTAGNWPCSAFITSLTHADGRYPFKCLTQRHNNRTYRLFLLANPFVLTLKEGNSKAKAVSTTAPCEYEKSKKSNLGLHFITVPSV